MATALSGVKRKMDFPTDTSEPPTKKQDTTCRVDQGSSSMISSVCNAISSAPASSPLAGKSINILSNYSLQLRMDMLKITEATMAILLKPDGLESLSQIFLYIAVDWWKSGGEDNYRRALDLCEKALLYVNKNSGLRAQLYHLMSAIHVARGDLPSAIALLEKATKMPWDDALWKAHILALLGSLLIIGGQPAAAASYLEKALTDLQNDVIKPALHALLKSIV